MIKKKDLKRTKTEKKKMLGEREGAVEQNGSENHVRLPSRSPRWRTQPPESRMLTYLTSTNNAWSSSGMLNETVIRSSAGPRSPREIGSAGLASEAT